MSATEDSPLLLGLSSQLSRSFVFWLLSVEDGSLVILALDLDAPTDESDGAAVVGDAGDKVDRDVVTNDSLSDDAAAVAADADNLPSCFSSEDFLGDNVGAE